MTLRILVCLLASQLIAIAAIALNGGEPWIIALLALISLATAVVIYCLSILPVHTLVRGVDMLRGQDFNSRLRLTGHDDTDKLVRMFNDMISSLHRERRRIRETNRYLDLLIDASPLGIINLDHDGNIDLINPSAAQILEIEPAEVKGKPRSALPGALGKSIADIGDGQGVTLDMRAGGSDDKVLSIACSSFLDRGFPRLTIFIEPMTDIIRATERDAYGRIIRVMAHEINNSMGAIRSTFDLLADTPAVAADPDLPTLIRSCAERTSSLSAFIDSYARVARLPMPDLVPTDVIQFLETILPALRAVAIGTELRLDASGGSFGAMLDVVQIEQVMVNIVKNAAESIARTSRTDGCIVISVEPSRRSITVADNGAGISSDVAPSIFTPFFTTKSGAAASGIGLTLTLEILRAHSAAFSLSTSPDDFLTRFTIKFKG